MDLDQHDGEAAFERLLLDAARYDGVSEAAKREAWSRFAQTAGTIALTSNTGPWPEGWLRSLKGAGVKWLAVGAVGGSAVTAAWLGSRASTAAVELPPAPAAVSTAAPAPPTAMPPEAGPTTPGPPDPGTEAAPTPAPETPSPHRAERSARRPEAAPSPASSTSTAPRRSASILAAEVAALDSVRTAISMGAFQQAVRLVDGYHRDFPHAQLEPDAEALAIEALRELGDGAEVARRARQFLERYPADPHAPRIARLLER